MMWDKNVSPLFPRFIPFSAFYPFFRVLFLFPRFILFSAFNPFFRVLSLFPRFIPFSTSAIPYFRNSRSVFYPNPYTMARKSNQRLQNHLPSKNKKKDRNGMQVCGLSHLRLNHSEPHESSNNTTVYS